MIFTVEVYEQREYRCRYTVDAKNMNEALEKADAGDTESEEDVQLIGVTSRNAVAGSVTKLKAGKPHG